MLQLYEKDYSRALSLANEHDTIDMDVILKTQWKNACEEGTVTVDAVTEILVGTYALMDFAFCTLPPQQRFGIQAN